ncbi:MAG: hypothetical protein IT330_14440 [Anaerolineae bacterium]|nr:hypothetical protein [Anaerolineae bacterium]
MICRRIAVGLVFIGLLVSGFPAAAYTTSRPTDPLPGIVARNAAEDSLFPEGWNVDTCAYPGGVGLFRGKIYNATEGTTVQDVNLWTSGFGGFPVSVTPDFLAETPALERFDVSVTVTVPMTALDAARAAPVVYTGTLYAEGMGTNRLSWPLALTVLSRDARCTKGQLVLDGVDDYAIASDDPALDVGDETTESLTVEARVLFSTFRAATIFSKENAYSLYTTAFTSGPYSLRCLKFSLKSGQTIRTIESCATQQGRGFWVPGWHHVAGVYDRETGEMRLYMDGQRLGSANQIGQVLVDNSTNGAWVGNDLAGIVEELRVSASARYTSASYAVPGEPFVCDATTRALWHFDELEGAIRFHDTCDTDKVLVGQEGAHAGGTPTWRLRAPLAVRRS